MEKNEGSRVVLDYVWYDEQLGYLDIKKLRESLLCEEKFKKEYLGKWVAEEPQPIYILASNFSIAKSIFNHYFLYTDLSRSIDLRYIDTPEKLYGLRNIFIVVSDERYPFNSFYERLEWIHDHAQYRDFEVVNEQDLEKEQVRQKVSRQRPKASKGE